VPVSVRLDRRADQPLLPYPFAYRLKIPHKRVQMDDCPGSLHSDNFIKMGEKFLEII